MCCVSDGCVGGEGGRGWGGLRETSSQIQTLIKVSFKQVQNILNTSPHHTTTVPASPPPRLARLTATSAWHRGLEAGLGLGWQPLSDSAPWRGRNKCQAGCNKYFGQWRTVRGCPYITSAAITRQGQLECLRTLT